MFRARCPARHTWELSPLYWPSLRVRTQYRVFLSFTHSLELLLLLNSPRMLRHGQGGEEAGKGKEDFFVSLHFNGGGGGGGGGQGLVLLFSSCNLFLHPLYHFCYGQLIHSQPPSFRLPFANRLTFWPLPTSLLKSHRVASQMNVALGGTHCLHSLGGIMTLQGEDAPDHLLAVLRRGFSL